MTTFQPLDRKCVACGASFAIATYDQKVLAEWAEMHGSFYRLPQRCPSCRETARLAPDAHARIAGWRLCSDCDGDYFFSPTEMLRFRERGWPAPRRCPSCRRLRRIERERDERARQEQALP